MNQKIQYFGRSFDPADYRWGFGVLGWLIFNLNAMRLWLEQRIAFLALRADLRREGVSRADRKGILAEARRDTSLRIDLYKPRLVGAPKPLKRDKVIPLSAYREQLVEGRYKEGRTNADDDKPERPRRIEEGGAVASIFASYLQKEDRSMRYYHGRQYMVRELEEDEDGQATPDPGAAVGGSPAKPTASTRAAYRAQRGRGPKAHHPE